jgi:hypothetical protein
MKKQVITLVAAFLAVGSAVQAQDIFGKKTFLLNAGAHVMKGSTPLTVSAEYGLVNHIGVGLRAYSEYLTVGNSLTGSAFVNYHFAPQYRIDPFVGMSAVKTFTSRAEGANFNNTYASLQAGARYLFTNRFGAYAQAVVPFKSNVKPGGEFGVTLKIGKLAN